MTLDFDLAEFALTVEELAAIRQAHDEARKNAALGGRLAVSWREEADRLAELLTFLEAPNVPPCPAEVGGMGDTAFRPCRATFGP